MISPRQVRILVVDDEASIRELLAARFSIFGYQTLTAASGDEAWRMICADSAIKIVISDLSMPDMNGQQLLEKLRASNPEFPKFFAITGQPNWPAETLYALGAEGVLYKPFDARTLLNVTRSALLNVNERLRYAPYTVPAQTIDLSFPSIEDAFLSGRFALGKGGAFVAIQKSIANDGQVVAFNLDCGSMKLIGTGVVRWRRHLSPKQGDHLGVEFLHLEPNGIAQFEAWLASAKPSAFIPSPQILASMPSTAKLQSTG